MKTNVYIDGFNLYYGCLKDTKYKWLNVEAMCKKVLPRGTVINKIHYFTARIRNRPDDPTKSIRQNTYIRALQTIPNLSVHYGFFKTYKQRRRLVTPLADGTKLVRVLDTKEKGSDVNLATMLLVDGFNNEYEAAAVVSNDSDLALPIEKVRTSLKLPITVISPDRDGRVGKELLNAATRPRLIRKATLKQCQFAETLKSSEGQHIKKPKAW